MKIAIFGASGKTGRHVVIQALEKGCSVNAFVRDPSKLQIDDPNLKFFVGDVLKPNTFGHALMDVDVVVVTLNGLMAEGIKNIVSEMRLRHVKRIILLSSYPMSGSSEGINYLKSSGMDQQKIESIMPTIKDKKTQEELVMESNFIWTIIRPTFLKDEPKTGNYQVKQNAEFDIKNGINRADVAEFIVEILTSNEWDNKVVSISS